MAGRLKDLDVRGRGGLELKRARVADVRIYIPLCSKAA